MAIHPLVCLTALAVLVSWSAPAANAAGSSGVRLSQASPGADGPYLRRPDGSLYKPDTWRPEKEPRPSTDQPTRPDSPGRENIPEQTNPPPKP